MSRRRRSVSSVSGDVAADSLPTPEVRISYEDQEICYSYLAKATKSGKSESRKRNAGSALLGLNALGSKRARTEPTAAVAAASVSRPRVGPLVKHLPASVSERGALFFKLSELAADRQLASLYEVSSFGLAKVLQRDGQLGVNDDDDDDDGNDSAVKHCKYSYKPFDDSVPETSTFETTEPWSYHVVKRCHKVYRSAHSSAVVSVLVPDVPSEAETHKLLDKANSVRDGELCSLEQLRLNNLNQAEAAGLKTKAEMLAEADDGDADREQLLEMQEQLEDPDQPCLDIDDVDPSKQACAGEITADEIAGPSSTEDTQQEKHTPTKPPTDRRRLSPKRTSTPKKSSPRQQRASAGSSGRKRVASSSSDDDDQPLVSHQNGHHRSPSTPPSLHDDDMARATVLIDEAALVHQEESPPRSAPPPRVRSLDDLLVVLVRGVTDKAAHDDELELRRVVSAMFNARLHAYLRPTHALWEYIRWYSKFDVLIGTERRSHARTLRCALCHMDHMEVVRCLFERTLGSWSDHKSVQSYEMCADCAELLKENFNECHDYVCIFDALAMEARKQLRRHEGSYSDAAAYLLKYRQWADSETLTEPLRMAIAKANQLPD